MTLHHLDNQDHGRLSDDGKEGATHVLRAKRDLGHHEEKNKSPTGGLEPPTTRLRAWRSTD